MGGLLFTQINLIPDLSVIKAFANKMALGARPTLIFSGTEPKDVEEGFEWLLCDRRVKVKAKIFFVGYDVLNLVLAIQARYMP